jgi:hypothetical protein
MNKGPPPPLHALRELSLIFILLDISDPIRSFLGAQAQGHFLVKYKKLRYTKQTSLKPETLYDIHNITSVRL